MFNVDLLFKSSQVNYCRRRYRKLHIFKWTICKVFCILIIDFFCVSCSSGKLKEKGLITIGTVKEIYRSGNKGSSFSLEYNYIVNKKLYKGKGGISSIAPELRRAIIGKHFPVIYLPENESESYILITQFDFSLFGKEYPDSLKWIEKNRE